MKKLYVLIYKEIKELLTIQMLLPLIIAVAVFALIGQIVGTETKKAEQAVHIGIIDRDNSQLSRSVVDALEQAEFTPEIYDVEDIEEAIDREKKSGGSFIVVIPENFERSIFNGKPEKIDIYTFLGSFSYTSINKASKLKGVIQGLNDAISSSLIDPLETDIPPEVLKNPLQYSEVVVVGDRMARASSEAVLGFVNSQTVFIPIIITIVIVFASQMVATAVASEKENKTLETILASPVKRSHIALSKMIAAGLVALLAALVYIFGFRSYMEGITGENVGQLIEKSGIKEAVDALGLVFKPEHYILLGLSLFFGILLALAISLILGSFADSVKSVQTVVTPLMIMVLIPYFLVMFLDINSLPVYLKYLVLAIPFSHPFLAAPNLFLSNYGMVIGGILYQFILFSVMVVVAGRIFSSDRILTMKISLKKAR